MDHTPLVYTAGSACLHTASTVHCWSLTAPRCACYLLACACPPVLLPCLQNEHAHPVTQLCAFGQPRPRNGSVSWQYV
eukprot:1149683-Pelagomonas_calceolata.AAC.7